jgi:VWFA-related protein
MNGRAFLSCILLSSLLLPISAQQPRPSPSPPPQPARTASPVDEQDVVRITTNLVQVDAVVTKDGKQVTDLSAEDFDLFEDGKPQKITHFSYVSNVPSANPTQTAAPPVKKDAIAAPVAPAVARPNDVRRTMALVIDDLGMSFESVSRVRKQARKFIDERLQPNDLVAIIRTGGEVGALQQFTTDKRMLYNAIDHLRWHPCSRAGLYVFAPAGSTATPGDAPCGGTRNIRDTLRSLKFIVQGLRELPGRKSLVLFSDHLPIETQEPGTTNSQVQNQNNTSAIDTGDADFGNDTTTYLGQLQRVAELAIRASVVIYAVDSRGLAYTGLTAADRFSGNGRAVTQQMNSIMSSRSLAMTANREGSELIAKQTGGFLIRNSNDFGLDRIADDQRGYYLLGYRPNDETFDKKFHHITLKVKRHGLTVRTRDGFFGISEEDARAKELTPENQFKKALMSPFGANDIALRLTTMFTNFADSGSMLRSLIYINAKDLTFVDEPDKGHKATFDLGIILFGDNGQVRNQQSRVVTLSLHDQIYERAVRNGIVYTLDTPIKQSGAFQFRIALKDQNSSRIGSAGEFVQIPNIDNGRLALSGLVLIKDAKIGSQDQNSTLGGPAQEKPPDDDLSSGPAIRQFRAGANLLFACSIYNAQLDQTTHLPQLTTQTRIFREGKLVLTGNSTPIDVAAQSDLKHIPDIGRLKLGPEFLPGDYVLQVVITDNLGKQKQNIISQWIDFEVVN